jgi:hypothetical protein
VLIGAGSGLAPFRGFWQRLTLDEGHCSDGSQVLDKVSFYEAFKPKPDIDGGQAVDKELNPLLARRARCLLTI